MPSPRYDEHRYDDALYGSPPTGYANSETPWAFGSTRVDGLAADEPLSPVVPGRAVTYSCRFLPDGSHGQRDHIRRAQTVADYLVRGADVVVMDPPGRKVFYREQYDGPSALLRIQPLRADHDATHVDGDPPPGRDSIHDGRWAVATGGTYSAPAGDQAPATVALETTTLAATETYPTREGMLTAAERNGFQT